MPAVMLTRSRRFFYGSLVLVSFFIFTLYYRHPVPKPLPPMPGTYQYFTEVNFEYHTKKFGAISHCDPRFAPPEAPGIVETRRALSGLLKSYAATMAELNAETWIAHGTLLGWYWNQKFLPWDNDIDVQMSVETLAGLVAHNRTRHSYTVVGEDSPRSYLLDINPHYKLVSTLDVANKIDGRWIDTTNGKYIDITAVHVSRGVTDNVPFLEGVYFSKDGHNCKRGDLFPLRKENFEGITVKVPHDPVNILKAEYGKSSLTNTRYHW
ncbi:mannosyltransferase [Exophiala oligosperma]